MNRLNVDSIDVRFTQQADNFCNSIGILQQGATPATFPGFDRAGNRTPIQQSDDHAQLFATLTARCAKDIDVLIDSLPSEDSTSELQVTRRYIQPTRLITVVAI